MSDVDELSDAEKAEILERFKSETASHCAPLFMQDAILIDGHDAKTRNATATFVTQGGRYYAVTCRHVIEIIKKRREKRRTPFPTLALPLQPKGFFNLDFVPVEGLKGELAFPHKGEGEETLDIAMADITDDWDVFAKQGKVAINMNADDWHEPKWARATILVAAGYPEDRKRNVTRGDGEERVFGTFTFISAEQKGGITRADRIVLMHSTLNEPHGYFFSGVSGGPMYVQQDKLLVPVGIVYEGWPQSLSTKPKEGLTEKDIFVRGFTLTPSYVTHWISAIKSASGASSSATS